MMPSGLVLALAVVALFGGLFSRKHDNYFAAAVAVSIIVVCILAWGVVAFIASTLFGWVAG